MIDRYYNQYTPTCDYCENTLPAAFSYRDARAKMRDAGWESRKSNGEWIDVCFDCQFQEKGYDSEK